MQFPESWLREFCNPPLTTEQLAELLTMAGMEVEEVRPAAPPFAKVVVGEIVEVSPHPDAERLLICKVEAGTGRPLQIVCGAPNARAGLRAPLALAGATLPPGSDGRALEIKVGKLRGIESAGMLCSASELGLSADHSGLMELEPNAPVGEDLRRLLDLDDAVFTLKLTPNLGHVLSVYGVAREVAALTGAPLKTPTIPSVQPTHDQRLPVSIEAPDLCGRFSGRVVRNVDTRALTPAWMVRRLARCGQRSVTALVDISNYVMFELGRPSHIFDLDKIHHRLIVRWAREGEQLKLLSGTTVELDPTVGVIADAAGVESLAGIMGGDATAVSEETRNIYVEAAFWWPDAVAGRSRRFNFSTDAGHRFERGVDPALTVDHIDRITALVLQVCGGEPGPMDDQRARLPEPAPVVMRVARAAKVIGMPVTQAQCEEVFTRLQLPFTSKPGELTVTPPSFRFDIRIEEDLIEEVIRVIGYGRLPDAPPIAPVEARLAPEARRPVHAVRRELATLGFQETISFSFVEERWERELAGNADPIRVLNPITAPLCVMRSSLIGSLVNVLRYNLARKAGRVRVFEIGRVFKRDPGLGDGDDRVAGVAQPMRLAALAYGLADALQWAEPERNVDFFDVKGDLQALLSPRAARFVPSEHPAFHPGRSARIEIGGRVAGHIGQLHPRWRQAYELPLAPVLFEVDLETLVERDVPSFLGIPRQQSAWRDMAFVVQEHVRHDDLMGAIHDDPSGLVKSATLFDIYKPSRPTAEIGAGEQSMAVRIEVLDEHATLTDERIDGVMAGVLARLRARFGAKLRG